MGYYDDTEIGKQNKAMQLRVESSIKNSEMMEFKTYIKDKLIFVLSGFLTVIILFAYFFFLNCVLQSSFKV